MNINARQIDALDFNYLDQSETYQYSVDQLARAKACAPLMAKLGSEVNAWEAATRAFDTAFRKASTAQATKSLQTIDSERDSYYSGFTGTVSNALKSPLQAQRDAAQQLSEPIKRYAVNTSGEYQQQTMRTAQLCQDLLENFGAALTTLGLTEWVQALQAKNTEFQQAMTARTNEQAGYIKSELTQLRQNIINAYRIFVRLANVVLIYEGDTAYAASIDQLNAEVRHYKQIIARKGGGSPTATGDSGSAPAPSSTSSGSADNDSNTGSGDNTGGSSSGSGGDNTGGSSSGSGTGSGSDNTGGSGTGSGGGSGDDGGGDEEMPLIPQA